MKFRLKPHVAERVCEFFKINKDKLEDCRIKYVFYPLPEDDGTVKFHGGYWMEVALDDGNEKSIVFDKEDVEGVEEEPCST